MHPARTTVVDGPALHAMRTAERVFAATSDPAGLLHTAAEALAIYPGQMCLVSLIEGSVLRPTDVAHVRTASAIELRSAMLRLDDFRADAFSRAVQRTGGGLRMQISNPSLLQLWLPRAYWDYAARTRISNVLAAPLTARRHVLGTLLLWREGTAAPPYTVADQAYLAGLAVRLALAL